MSLFRKNRQEQSTENMFMFTHESVNPDFSREKQSEKADEINLSSLAVKNRTDKTPESSYAPTDDVQEQTLLEKCRPFIIDDNGGDDAMHREPTYRLQSVAEILKEESEKTLSRLSEKYDIAFDDLKKYDIYSAEETPAPKPDKPKTETTRTEKIYSDSRFNTEEQVFEELLPDKTELKNVHTNISFISDIDYEDNGDKESYTPDISETATVKFTPVTGIENTTRISVSSSTRSIDLTNELLQLSDETEIKSENELRLEQNEFEEYIPKEEFTADVPAKTFVRKLSLKKRSCFIKFALSLVLMLAVSFMRLPFMSSVILSHTQVSMIICTALTGIIILLNIDMFKSLSVMLSRRSSPDTSAALASLTVTVYAVFGIFKKEITLNMLVLLSVILTVRAMCALFKSSYTLSNFKHLASNAPKRAIKLISDPAVTFAMAKNSIEGDVLAAAPQPTEHIDDYMKYAAFNVFFGGKFPIITVLSVLLSIITGFTSAAYFDGIIYGLYSAAVIQCLSALPTVFFIDSLPLYSAAKKLNRLGAVITGKIGAQQIENSNAAVFASEDLFPSGTVTLHNMTLLSDNNIDDTIIRAASLTECLQSPLCPIFKKIVSTGNIAALPDSDTVKYEDRMGISGWVDNKLLFVGNRTLMEAHGISVPDIETDRKILRNGFFPVYVASENKALALLSVQYTVRPEVAYELRRLSASGVTLLINNSDPNLTEEMICDYMGLYDDSVKVMSSAGCHMYKNAVSFTRHCPAPAVYKGNPIGLAAIVNSSIRIKKSNILLTVIYAIAAIAGTVLFAYLSFDGSGTLINTAFTLLYTLAVTLLSLILYFTEKP